MLRFTWSSCFTWTWSAPVITSATLACIILGLGDRVESAFGSLARRSRKSRSKYCTLRLITFSRMPYLSGTEKSDKEFRTRFGLPGGLDYETTTVALPTRSISVASSINSPSSTSFFSKPIHSNNAGISPTLGRITLAPVSIN